MITISHEQLEKINLLDRLFGSMGVAELRQFVESEQVIAKLKGTEENPQLLLKIVHEHDVLLLDLAAAKNDIVSLRSDVKDLVKALANLYQPFSNELTNLKNKHGVY